MISEFRLLSTPRRRNRARACRAARRSLTGSPGSVNAATVLFSRSLPSRENKSTFHRLSLLLSQGISTRWRCFGCGKRQVQRLTQLRGWDRMGCCAHSTCIGIPLANLLWPDTDTMPTWRFVSVRRSTSVPKQRSSSRHRWKNLKCFRISSVCDSFDPSRVRPLQILTDLPNRFQANT